MIRIAVGIAHNTVSLGVTAVYEPGRLMVVFLIFTLGVTWE